MKENPNTKPKLIKRIPNIPKKPQKGSKFNIFWVYAAIIL
jgi:cell division protease FtsH